MTSKSATAKKSVTRKSVLSEKNQARLNALRNAPPRTAEIKQSLPTVEFTSEALLAVLHEADST
jgi:hypothetical protein